MRKQGVLALSDEILLVSLRAAIELQVGIGELATLDFHFHKATCLVAHMSDASKAGVETGKLLKTITTTGSAITDVTTTESQSEGFISPPNGLGVGCEQG